MTPAHTGADTTTLTTRRCLTLRRRNRSEAHEPDGRRGASGGATLDSETEPVADPRCYPTRDGGHTLAQTGVAIACPQSRGQVIRGQTSERPLSSSQGEDASPTFGQPSTAAVTDVCSSPSFQEFRNSGEQIDFPRAKKYSFCSCKLPHRQLRRAESSPHDAIWLQNGRALLSAARWWLRRE